MGAWDDKKTDEPLFFANWGKERRFPWGILLGKIGVKISLLYLNIVRMSWKSRTFVPFFS